MRQAVIGRGVRHGALTARDVEEVAREGLSRMPVDGRRVLVIVRSRRSRRTTTRSRSRSPRCPSAYAGLAR